MKKIKTFGSGLFLLELMISIAFFAIAAAGCVQIFARAHSLGGQAERLDQAVSIAQSLTEENSGQNAESKTWYYDDQGVTCEEAKAVYQAKVAVQTQDQMRQIQVTVEDGISKTVLYRLETAVYCPGEADTRAGGSDE